MRNLIFTLFILTVLSSCAQRAQKLQTDTPATEISIPENENPIVNKYWKLISLQGKAIQMAENQEREQYFILRSDGTLTGFAGCNQFHGRFELRDGDRIRFNKNLATTRKACPNGDIDENDFLNVFKVTDNYSINGDTLHLNVGKRAALAIFEAVYF